MARNNLGSPFAGTLSDGGGAGSGTTNIDPDVYASIMDVTTAREALQTLDSTTYTDKVLDNMTRNDMVYALRVLLQPSSFQDPPLTEAEEFPAEPEV